MDFLRWLELKKREIGFSHNALVIIAMFTMFLDHFALMIIQNGKLFGYDPGLYAAAIALPEGGKWLTIYKVLRCIGRISFPIYCFLIVEGFRKTSNVFKYFFRILTLAIISEIPYDLMVFNRFISFEVQNVLFTYVVALLMLSAIKKMSSLPQFLTVVPAILAGMITCFFKTDYCGWGILIIYIMYMFRHDLNVKCLLIIFITVIMTIEKYYAVGALSVFFIYFYDGSKGYISIKKFHYLFYPLHMLILYGVIYFSNVYN